MKKLSNGVNILLAVAIVILYILHFTGEKKLDTVKDVDGKASIVYINTDSLLMNYDMAKDLNEAFFNKQEERRTSLNIKAKALEKEAADFQNKVQNNGFLSRERAESVQRELLTKRESLQNLQNEYSQTSMTEQREINTKLFETITAYLKKFNESNNYDLILSTVKGGNVFYSKEGLDITSSIIDGLNKEYKK